MVHWCCGRGRRGCEHLGKRGGMGRRGGIGECGSLRKEV